MTLSTLASGDKVDRLAADDAAQRMLSTGGMHVHTKPRQNGGIDATDGGHGQKPVIGDVDHHQADLVHVGGQHERRREPCLQGEHGPNP